MAAIIGLTILLVLPLRWLNPITTVRILLDDAADSPWLVDSQWTTIDHIAPELQIAVIAAQDRHFADDRDVYHTEIRHNTMPQTDPSTEGHTLPQQLMNQIYLWPEPGTTRRWLASYLAAFTNVLLPKQRILELYLNVADFGSGIDGIHQAATLFNKTPAQLNRIEASLLAAVLSDPQTLQVTEPSAQLYESALDIRFVVRRLGGVVYLDKVKWRGR